MADRRSLLSRFWPPSASRRPSTTPIAAAPPLPPPATTRRTPQYQSSSPTSSPPPPRVDTKTPAPTTPPRGETKTSAPATPTRTGPRKASSSADTKEEPKTLLPSHSTTRSPSSSKPSSPSRFSSQSRSPSQPSSSPQSQSTLPSPSRPGSTPKRVSKPPSPTHGPSPSPSPSPKGKNPASPSKDPTEKTSTSYEAPILASKGNDPELAASQQEAEVKEEVRTDRGQTPEETSFKQDSAEAGETKDVKEVVQETKNEATTNKEVNDFVAQEPVSEAKIVEEAENPNEAKQEATNTNLKKSKNSGAHDKFVPSNEEHKNIRDEMSKFSNKLAGGDHKKATSERGVSMITLAGENRGASMHIESDSSRTEGPIPIHRSYKIKPDESSEATADGDGIGQGNKSEDEKSMEDQATEAYVNNNAQAINNSIVFNSSITEGSPGVHMVVSHLQRKARDETKSSHQTPRAEVNVNK